MFCKTHTTEEAVYSCDRCGDPICQECYERCGFSVTEEILCWSCMKDAINESIKCLRKFFVKGILIIALLVLGFALGLVLGLDVYYGWGILVDEPTNFVFAPILLPFVLPLIYHLVVWGKEMFEKEKERSGDDSSLGYNFVVIIWIIIRALAIAPFGFVYSIVKIILNMIKSKKAQYEYTEILHLMYNEERERNY